MFGGSEPREIPELAPYAEIEFHLATSRGKNWGSSAITGGNLRLTDLDDENLTEIIFK